jgi:hypothetical protein
MAKSSKNWKQIVFVCLLVHLLVSTSTASPLLPERGSVDAVTPTDLPRHIHVTYQGNPAYTATVTWSTNSSTAGDDVLYDVVSRGGDPLQYRYQVTGDHTAHAAEWIHTVKLTSLEPDTRYYFVCGGPGNFSAERSVKTAPRLASEVLFVVGGDLNHFKDDNLR